MVQAALRMMLLLGEGPQSYWGPKCIKEACKFLRMLKPCCEQNYLPNENRKHNLSLSSANLNFFGTLKADGSLIVL